MDIEERFDQVMQQFPFHEKSIVGVSGGSDSMALALLLHRFLCRHLGNSSNLIAVTVDHRQRPESIQEAQTVQKWLCAYGIQHKILVWDHAPLTSRVEEQGRQARYRLMGEFCIQNKCSLFYTAHHAQDQIETFLMRLKRGSGLSGLSSIRPVRLLNSHSFPLRLIRPLLEFFPQELKLFLKQLNQSFVHDPCNDNEAYERCQTRNNWSFLEQMGLSPKALLSSIKQLQSIDHQLQEEAELFLRNSVVYPAAQLSSSSGSSGFSDFIASFSLSTFKDLLPHVAKLALKHILENQKATPCPQRILDSLYTKMLLSTFHCTTAHQCLIKRKKDKIFVAPENRPFFRSESKKSASNQS